jgi:mannan endo-1,4-beta-mannosidase
MPPNNAIANLARDRRAFLNLSAATIIGVLDLTSSDGPHAISKRQSRKIIHSAPFVMAEGQELRLEGRPYRFIGLNRYNLMTPKGGGCGGSFSDRDLERWFNEVRKIGVNAVRFWLFESITKDNFKRFDRLLELAAANSMKVIPVLEDEWASCSPVDQQQYAGEDGRKNALWYQEGYQKSYKPYVERVVKQYHNNPNILMWQLMNEAANTDTSALRNFTQDMSTSIRILDKNHLISLGTTGNNEDGIDTESYRILHTDPNISLLEYHDYNEPKNPLPNALAERFNDSKLLNKPLFMGEAGIQVDGHMTPERRAELFRAKIDAFFSGGGTGYNIWSGPNVHQTKSVSYGFVLSDPLVPVITEMATKYCGFTTRLTL